MPEPLVYVDRSEIRAGKLEDVKAQIQQLTEFIESNEPQLISYAVYIDDERQTMTVVHVHDSPASLAFHMEIAAPRFRDFAELVSLRSIDIYGAVDGEIISQLRKKAQLLGNAKVRTQGFHVGFLRSPA